MGGFRPRFLEATKLIRKEERRHGLARTPILALTAHTCQSQHEQCLAEGMDAVITKPVNPPALSCAIRAVLSTVGPRRELEQQANIVGPGVLQI